MTNHIITLNLNDEEIALLKAASGNMRMLTRPGLQFSEITDESIRRSAMATSLDDKVKAATEAVTA